MTFLLVGSDTRAEIVDGEIPDARSDAIMLARLSGDRQHVQVVSIPRDSWVDIPGYGMNKINAAYAFGGPSLLIQTIENLTGVRIDHFAAISFNGLISMTDQLGGVDVEVAETTTNGPYTFTQGLNHLDGDMARWYVGQRYDLPGGDFDRVKRQQNYLRSMFGKLFAAGTFDSVGQIDSVLQAVTSSIAVDDSLSNAGLLELALSARSLTPAGWTSSPRRCWAPARRARPAWSTWTRRPATGCGATCRPTHWARTLTSSATRPFPPPRGDGSAHAVLVGVGLDEAESVPGAVLRPCGSSEASSPPPCNEVISAPRSVSAASSTRSEGATSISVSSSGRPSSTPSASSSCW
ncbi:LCP family protein [Klenkia terrae]|uniref:LCP family protein n=1 Tax=Klenkia terrae TaxID=1052259 RepID=UPI003608A73F